MCQSDIVFLKFAKIVYFLTFCQLHQISSQSVEFLCNLLLCQNLHFRQHFNSCCVFWQPIYCDTCSVAKNSPNYWVNILHPNIYTQHLYAALPNPIQMFAMLKCHQRSFSSRSISSWRCSFSDWSWSTRSLCFAITASNFFTRVLNAPFTSQFVSLY